MAPEPTAARLLRLGAAVVVTVCAAGLAVGFGLAGAVAVAGVVLCAFVARRPQWAAYLYAATTPLTVGIARGSLIPAVRVNEAILVVLATSALSGGMWRLIRDRRSMPRLLPLDIAVIALATVGSVGGLYLMWAQGTNVQFDDVAYALVLPKFALVYFLMRLCVGTALIARRVVVSGLVACAIVASLGLAQALNFRPIGVILDFYSEAPGNEFRGFHATSTVGSALALGDMMSISFALAVAFALYVGRRRALSVIAAALFAVGALATGEFSSILGLLVVIAVLAVVTKRQRLLIAISPAVAAVAIPIVVPVFAARLDKLDPSTGLPLQWTGDAGRVANLTTYILPQFHDLAHWLLGVRLSAQVPSPYPWADYLYIECGYLWALWGGGVPLLAACLGYMLSARSSGLSLIRLTQTGSPRLVDGSVAKTYRLIGVGVTCAFTQMLILMTLDPHLTYRGAADTTFGLAGVSAALLSRRLEQRPAMPTGETAIDRAAEREASA